MLIFKSVLPAWAAFAFFSSVDAILQDKIVTITRTSIFVTCPTTSASSLIHSTSVPTPQSPSSNIPPDISGTFPASVRQSSNFNSGIPTLSIPTLSTSELGSGHSTVSKSSTYSTFIYSTVSGPNTLNPTIVSSKLSLSSAGNISPPLTSSKPPAYVSSSTLLTITRTSQSSSNHSSTIWTTISSATATFDNSSSTSTTTTISSTTTSTTSCGAQCSNYCENTPTSRQCWGNYSIDTDWYSTVPDTGVTREYWLSIENTTLAPDGYERYTLTFNGTIPGPAIIADWGDNLIIHVVNNLQHNGTSIHWHGLRQLGSSEYDGVPGVTQCPIAPGGTMTYRFRATQYGSTWYHSHFSLQYADGLFGPLILNGPATANYDEDLGLLFLSDWSHTSAFSLWDSARAAGPPSLDGGLVNGTNTYNCSASVDPNCVGGGKKFETVFVPGKRYRIRLINVAIEGHFQFSIDGHNLTVIANDLVPIVPYETNSIVIGEGQRYDLIVEANAEPGDYWLRSGWQAACAANQNADDMTGIIRYDASSTVDPVTTSDITITSNCADEPLSNLVPHLAMNVGNFSEVTQETLSFVFESYFMWTINSSSLYMNWSDPTTLRVVNNQSTFPTEYNVVSVEQTNPSDEWTVYVIKDESGIGLSHPIHLHGHDFWVIGQAEGAFDLATSELNLVNPPRRDVASLPANGYLAIAFKKDNPGAWIMHCHIAWHASEGLGLQFVESPSQITMALADKEAFEDTCVKWDAYTPTEIYLQDDSGV